MDGSNEIGGIAADALCSYVARVERLDEERRALSADMSEVYKEAKWQGYDVKALKRVIQLRRMDRDARRELGSLVELYESAIAGTDSALHVRAQSDA